MRRAGARAVSRARASAAAPPPWRRLGSSTGGSGGAASSAPRRAWAAYTRALEARPLLVKTGSAVAIFTSGDLLVQSAELGSLGAPKDWQRTGRMAAFGVAATLFMHNWWGFLEPRAAALFCPVEQRFANALFKMVADQSFGASCFNALFFGQSALLEGRTPFEAVERIGEQWWPQMQTHWCFWPAFHLCNFYFNTLHLRIFYQNIGSIGWSCVLSRTGAAAANGKTPGEATEVAAIL